VPARALRGSPAGFLAWPLSPAANLQSPPARLTGGPPDYMIRQMIGQRTACQLLAGEGASRVLDAEIM